MRKFLLVFLLFFLVFLSPLLAIAENKSSKKAPVQLEARNVKNQLKGGFLINELDTKGRLDTPPGLNKPDDPGDEPSEPEVIQYSVSQDIITKGILGEPADGKKFAILIGISDYPRTRWDLADHDEDASNMASELSKEIYGFDKIHLLQDMNATRDNIYAAIIDIRDNWDISSDDEVVFFYSGHGATGIYGAEEIGKVLTLEDEAIMTHNGRNKIEYIWDDELKEWFAGFNTSRITFIFDTCGAGGFNDLAGEGRLLLMSAKENETSHVYWEDGQMTAEGLFSHWFVNEGMLLGNADSNSGTADITLEEAFDYAMGKIQSDPATSDQHPVSVDLFVNDLLL